jgi:tetratricopeptide (TPR) repeat protein
VLEEMEDAEPPSSAMNGDQWRQVAHTADEAWRRDRLGPLDYEVFGGLGDRDAADTGGRLTGQADDQWHEARRALRSGSADLSIGHLVKGGSLRPLDGESRYWSARLQFSLTDGSHGSVKVADEAAVAAAALAEEGRRHPAGLAHLLEAKAHRAGGRFERAAKAVTRSVELIGWHYAEPNIEQALLSLEHKDHDEAYQATRRAFMVTPASYRWARPAYEGLETGEAALDDFGPLLAAEIDEHLDDMHTFGESLHTYAVELAKTVSGLRNSADREAYRELRPLYGHLGATSGSKIDPDLPEITVPAPAARPNRGSAPNPEALARDGVSKALESLDRLRDIEAMLQRLAATGHDAHALKKRIVERRSRWWRHWRGLLGVWAILALQVAALQLVTSSPQVTLSLVLGGLLLAIVLAHALRIHHISSSASIRLDELAKLSDDAWQPHATYFRRLVHEYERLNVAWRCFVPRSQLPYVDTRLGFELSVEPSSSAQLADRTDLEVLAPDFRIRAGELVDEPITSVLKPVMALPENILLGLSEGTNRKGRLVAHAPARWKAYRHPGTGPTGPAGKQDKDGFWIGSARVDRYPPAPIFSLRAR